MLIKAVSMSARMQYLHWSVLLQITPKRMEFVKEKEAELFTTLDDLAANKQNELHKIISETKDSLIPVLLDKAEDYAFLGILYSNKWLYMYVLLGGVYSILLEGRYGVPMKCVCTCACRCYTHVCICL